jgi:leader peptidase (prepilin peptidase)/N-methyltransferase
MPGLVLILRILLAISVLLVLALISLRDAQTSQIPDALNFSLLVLAVVALLIVPEINWLSRLLGALIISGPLLLLAMLKPGSIGGGDIKLMAAAGLLLGWQYVMLATVLGLFFAVLYGLWLVVIKHAKLEEKFPFGPALCTGIAIAYFFGPVIVGVLW